MKLKKTNIGIIISILLIVIMFLIELFDKDFSRKFVIFKKINIIIENSNKYHKNSDWNIQHPPNYRRYRSW